MLKTVIGSLSVLTALASAALWFWAANLKLYAVDFDAHGGATPEAAVAKFAKQAGLNS